MTMSNLPTYTYPTGFCTTFPHAELSEPIKALIQAHWEGLQDDERQKIVTNLGQWEQKGRPTPFTPPCKAVLGVLKDA